MCDRDLDANPYDPQERRVCDYLKDITGDTIGCGDDPVGWLLASHACVIQERNDLRAEVERLRDVICTELTAEAQRLGLYDTL